MKETIKRLARIFFIYSIRIISLLLAVTIVSFLLVSVSPIDPVQQYILGLGTAISPEQRAEIEDYWGINKPPAERYFSWLSEVLQGNLGESALYRRPVADIICERFLNCPAPLALPLAALWECTETDCRTGSSKKYATCSAPSLFFGWGWCSF